jgi:hypothetical protein
VVALHSDRVRCDWREYHTYVLISVVVIIIIIIIVIVIAVFMAGQLLLST